MTLPTNLGKRLFRRGPYTDNDEAERRRARGVAKLQKSYEAGGAQSDIDSRSLDHARNAATDYDMFSKVRPQRSLKHTRLPKKR